MPRFHFDPKFNANLIVTLLMGVLTVATAWAVRDHDLKRIVTNDEAQGKHIVQLQINEARAQEQRDSLKAQLDRIEKKLDALIDRK